MQAKHWWVGIVLVGLMLALLMFGFQYRDQLANNTVVNTSLAQPLQQLELHHLKTTQYDKRVSSQIEVGSFIMKPKKYLLFHMQRILVAELRDVVFNIYQLQDMNTATVNPMLALHQLVQDRQLLNKLIGVLDSATIKNLIINIYKDGELVSSIRAQSATLNLRSGRTQMERVVVESPLEKRRLIAKLVTLDNKKSVFRIAGRSRLISPEGMLKRSNVIFDLSLQEVQP